MRSHGRYQFSTHGRIVYALALDTWNLETLTRYIADLKAIGRQMKGQSWAIVVDARNWGMAGLDIQEPLRELGAALDRLDRTHTMIITGAQESLLKYLLESPITARSNVTVGLYETPEETLQHLEEAGFDVSELRQEVFSCD